MRKIRLILCLCLATSIVVAQNKKIKGAVKDTDNQPLMGVTVIVKGTQKGTSTDFDGNYTIEVKEGDELEFSFVGMGTKLLKVGTENVLNVTLEETAKSLDEVVMVGYGTQKKQALTSSIASAKGDVIKRSQQATVANAMSGRFTGVTVLNRSGEPGSEFPTLRIRGLNKPGDNAPLYVIDGVAGSLRSFTYMNPEDIESISVLKDASAAIYGSQAANGVILITTKKGKKGKPVFNLTYNQSFLSPAVLPRLTDAKTYATIENEIKYYVNKSKGMYQVWKKEELDKFGDGSDPDKYSNADWLNTVLKKVSFQRNTNFSVSGGGDNFSYRTSLGMMNQKGVFVDGINDYSRVNLLTNLDFDVSKDLKVSLTLDIKRSEKIYPLSWVGSIFRALIRAYPTKAIKYSNGKYSHGIGDNTVNNPLLMVNGTAGDRKFLNTRVAVLLNIHYKIPWVKGLFLKGFYEEGFSSDRNTTKKFPYETWGMEEEEINGEMVRKFVGQHRGPVQPELSEYRNNSDKQFTHLRIGYDKVLGSHTISTFIAYEQQSSKYSDLGAGRTHFYTDKIMELNKGNGDPKRSWNSGYYTHSTRQHVFGRLSYNFLQKYMLDVQLRYDGSSIFAKGKRFGFFPGVGFAWRISEEDFFNIKAINGLKIRASYGELGNDKVDGFQFLDTYNLNLEDFASSAEASGVEATLSLKKLPNANITWEIAKKFDIGFDLSFLHLFNAEFTYFTENREGLLTSKDISIPAVSGISGSIIPQENIGKVKNQGIEFALSYNQTFGDFEIFASSNFTLNKNEVVFMDDNESLPEYQLKKGKPYGSQLLYQSLGIFKTKADLEKYVKLPAQQLGDIIFKDMDGDGKITGLDRVRQDLTSVPQMTYGISIGCKYKQFDINLLFQGQARSVLFVIPESGEMGNFFKEWADNRWSPNNPNGNYPRVVARAESSIIGGTNPSTFWLRNSTFVRFKNFEIGCNFPKKNLFGFSAIRLYLSGTNLITFSEIKDIDPESESTTGQYYPQNRIFNIGINLKF